MLLSKFCKNPIMSKDTDRRLLKRFSRCPKALPKVSLNFTSDALRSKIWCFRKRFNPSHRLRVRLRNNINLENSSHSQGCNYQTFFFCYKTKIYLQAGARASLKFSFQRCGGHILSGVKSQVSIFAIMAISINTTHWLGLGFVPSSV